MDAKKFQGKGKSGKVDKALAKIQKLRSGPHFSDMTLSDCSVCIVPKNTGTDYD